MSTSKMSTSKTTICYQSRANNTGIEIVSAKNSYFRLLCVGLEHILFLLRNAHQVRLHSLVSSMRGVKLSPIEASTEGAVIDATGPSQSVAEMLSTARQTRGQLKLHFPNRTISPCEITVKPPEHFFRSAGQIKGA